MSNFFCNLNEKYTSLLFCFRVKKEFAVFFHVHVQRKLAFENAKLLELSLREKMLAVFFKLTEHVRTLLSVFRSMRRQVLAAPRLSSVKSDSYKAIL